MWFHFSEELIYPKIKVIHRVALIFALSFFFDSPRANGAEFESSFTFGSGSQSFFASGAGELNSSAKIQDTDDSSIKKIENDSKLLWKFKVFDSYVSMFDTLNDNNIDLRTLGTEISIGFQKDDWPEIGIELGQSHTFGLDIDGLGPLVYVKFDFHLDSASEIPCLKEERIFCSTAEWFLFISQKKYSELSSGDSTAGSRQSGFSWNQSAIGSQFDAEITPLISVSFAGTIISLSQDVKSILGATQLEERADAAGIHSGAEDSPFEFARSVFESSLVLHFTPGDVGIAEKRIDLGDFSSTLWSTELTIGKIINKNFYLAIHFERAVLYGSENSGTEDQAYTFFIKWL